MNPTAETWVIPRPPSPADDPAPGDWLDQVRRHQAQAWCVVTDTEVHGPYTSWEEAQSLLDEGIRGDVFPLTYR